VGEARAVALLDGHRARAELRSVGRRQVDFAATIGVRPEVLSRALHGKPISVELLFRIALGIALLDSAS
jgi:hypothetical protein